MLCITLVQENNTCGNTKTVLCMQGLAGFCFAVLPADGDIGILGRKLTMSPQI